MWYNQNPWMTEKEFYERLEKEKNIIRTDINENKLFVEGDVITSLPPQTHIIHLCPKDEAKKREIQRNRMISAQNTKIKLIISTKKKYVKFVLPGNRTISAQNEKKIKVKCHKDDKFDWKIGFGLALCRQYEKINKEKYLAAKEHFTNKKGVLNYKKLSEWALMIFFDNDYNLLKKFEEKIDAIKAEGVIWL